MVATGDSYFESVKNYQTQPTPFAFSQEATHSRPQRGRSAPSNGTELLISPLWWLRCIIFGSENRRPLAPSWGDTIIGRETPAVITRMESIISHSHCKANGDSHLKQMIWSVTGAVAGPCPVVTIGKNEFEVLPYSSLSREICKNSCHHAIFCSIFEIKEWGLWCDLTEISIEPYVCSSPDSDWSTTESILCMGSFMLEARSSLLQSSYSNRPLPESSRSLIDIIVRWRCRSCSVYQTLPDVRICVRSWLNKTKTTAGVVLLQGSPGCVLASELTYNRP